MIKFFLHETMDNTAWVYKTDCEGISSLEAEGRTNKEEEVYSNCVCSRGGLINRNNINITMSWVRFQIMAFNLRSLVRLLMRAFRFVQRYYFNFEQKVELLPFSDDDKHRSDTSKLIHSVERVEDTNRILLLVEKNKKEYVIKWLKMIKFFLHETVDNTV